MQQPNIIFLHSHNTGQHVEPYGHAVPTPNLMRLAREGVLFRNAFAAAPTCSPSRGAFLTGLYPHCNGLIGLAHRGWGLNDAQQHIVHTLRPAGYHTALCGVEHTGRHCAVLEDAIGYDEVLVPASKYAHDITPKVVEFLQRPPAQPFFLSVGLHETHTPFPEPEPEKYEAENPDWCIPPRALPDTPQTRAMTAGFKASARAMDNAWGAILDALDENGLAENTYVFCFTDHGLQFPLYIANAFERGLEVYFLARGPEHFEAGKSFDALVSLLDLFPTVCDLAGIEHPPWLQGKSLLPLVRGEKDELHEQLFGEQTYHAAYEPQRTVRTARYRYIRRYDDRDQPVLANADDTPAKAALLELGWLEQPRDEEMLFDLAFDPGEANNLIGEPRMAEVAREMRARLDTWMRETNDPLLHGPVPPPSGARLTDADAANPTDSPRIVE
jgi:arylsulfatase A-like enzyme